MDNFELQYLKTLQNMLDNGRRKEDRTGTGTLSLFGATIRHDLSKGLPLLTTKRVHFKSVAHELLWFLMGGTNTSYLKDNGVTIWDNWADGFGQVGRIYGAQWRGWRASGLFSFGEKSEEGYIGNRKTPHGRKPVYRNDDNTMGWYEVDQISEVIDEIKNNPNSRRLLVSAWNVGEVPQMALPPCHYAFQFEVCNGKLSCMFQMRSVDVFLGLPFNMASYALLTHMVAQVCDLEVGDLIWVGGDVHLYMNHIEQAKEQLTREPMIAPMLKLNEDIRNIFHFEFKHITLENYNPHPSIKAPVAV